MLKELLNRLTVMKNQGAQIESLRKETRDLQVKCERLEGLLAQSDYLPAPPQHLRVRVGGWEEVDHFLAVGRKILWDLRRLLKPLGKDLGAFHSILDFGCGCGRVTRFIRPSAGQTVIGADIDAESIAWCNENLRHIAEFRVNDALPPLPFADRTFDFVYCISVFTHLPEDMQFAWLGELKRITKPRGIFITSVHGEGLLPADSRVVDDFASRGYAYLKGAGTAGLPDFYQTAYHSKSYVVGNWGKYFKMLDVATRAINNQQDGVVCLRE